MKKIYNFLIISIFIIINNQLFAEKVNIVTINYPPFVYEENKVIYGVATQIVQTIFKEANVNYKIDVHSWPRSYKLALTTENYMVYRIFRNKHRENLFKWIGPIMGPTVINFYKLKNRKNIKINTLEDAKKYHVGLIKDESIQQLLLDNNFEHLQFVNNLKQNVDKLFKERVDIIVANDYSLFYIIKKYGYDAENIEKVYSALESQPSYMGFNLNTDDRTIKKIDNAFQELKNNGQLNEIILKFKL